MDFTSLVRGLVGLLAVTGLAIVFSRSARSINRNLVVAGIAFQFVFAFIVLKTAAGRAVFSLLSGLFVRLFSFTAEGAQFVFGPLAKGAGEPGSLGVLFAFQVLPTIIFFASLMSVLYHLGIMQRVVQAMAWVMMKLMRASGAESLCVAANTFVGQTEAPLVIRPYLASLTESELLTIMTGGMAHIAVGVMAVYVQMLAVAYSKAQGSLLDPVSVQFTAHFLAASIMAGPATITIAKILIPESSSPQTLGTVKMKVEKVHSGIIEAAAAGAGDGLRLALNVGGMLIAFIALIALINYLLGQVGTYTGLNAICMTQFGKPLNLELLFGLTFQIVAYVIGVPWHDALNVGSLMGVKLVLNEFVAYTRMADAVSLHQLSEKAIVISTYALCGFANFSSIAIQIGGIGPLAENRRGDIAKLGLKAVLGGTIATWMTASIAGIFA